MLACYLHVSLSCDTSALHWESLVHSYAVSVLIELVPYPESESKHSGCVAGARSKYQAINASTLCSGSFAAVEGSHKVRRRLGWNHCSLHHIAMEPHQSAHNHSQHSTGNSHRRVLVEQRGEFHQQVRRGRHSAIYHVVVSIPAQMF